MGKLKIKPENEKKFTAWAKARGMSVQQAARHVLRNREKYSPTLIKRANYARKAAKWADGGVYGVRVGDDDIPSYSKGGNYFNTIGGTLMGAAGVIGSPFTGGASLALLGPGAQMVGKGIEGFSADADAKEQSLLKAQSMTDVSQTGVTNNYVQPWKTGGMFKGKRFGYKPGEENAEIEDGETVLTPDDGVMTNAKGKRHNEGGMKVQLPDGALIFSRKYSKEVAPLAKKINKGKELLAGSATKLSKGGVQRNLNKYYASALDTFNKQEAKKVKKLQTGDEFYADEPDSLAISRYNKLLGNTPYVSPPIPYQNKWQGEAIPEYDVEPWTVNSASKPIGLGAALSPKEKIKWLPNVDVYGQRSVKPSIGDPMFTGLGYQPWMQGTNTGGQRTKSTAPINKPTAPTVPNDYTYQGKTLPEVEITAKRSSTAPIASTITNATTPTTTGPTNWTPSSAKYNPNDWIKPEVTPEFGSLNNWQTDKISFNNPLDNPNLGVYDPAASKASARAEYDKMNPGSNFGWMDAAVVAGELAPTIFNAFSRKAKGLDERRYQNWEKGRIEQLMQDRDYNIDPELALNEATRNTTAENMRSMGGSRGQVAGNLRGAQNAKMFGDMSAHATRKNKRNEYAGDYANMLYGLGRDDLSGRMAHDEAEAMDYASWYNNKASTMTGLQNYLLQRRLMKNQMSQSQLLANAIKGHGSGYGDKWVPDMDDYIRNQFYGYSRR